MTDAAFDRRRFLAALAAAPVLTALLQACGEDDRPAAPRALRSDRARNAADLSLALDAATSINLFGTDLFRQFAAADPTSNIVMSPTSIALALGMAAAGAGGATLTEFLRVLRIDVEPAADQPAADELAAESAGARLHAGMNAVEASLTARNRSGVEVEIANATWLQDEMAIAQPYLDVLAEQYGGGVETVDFTSDPDSARRAINGWVAERTKDRIPDLLAPDALDELTRFVLVNAVYLSARWAEPFSPDLTRDAPFTTAAGEIVEVPMMVRQAELPHASGDGWQAVELSYVGDELAMLLFLPEPGFLPTFEEIFLVTDATQYLEPRLVLVQLPRWDIASDVELADELFSLGLTTAFREGADFTRIATDVALHIGTVGHQASIAVGEEGTEASAASAVIGEAGSAPPVEEPLKLTFDRPFVFALRDRLSGAVLFLGRVADPRA